MTLSRTSPLRSDPSHTWKFVEAGARLSKWVCVRCGTRRSVIHKDELPDRWCNGLKRTELERGEGVNAYNAERRARSRTEDGERHTYGDYFRWACERRCCACGTYPCVPHHLDTVGSGGRDAENLIDCCGTCHDQIETEGLSSWEAEHGIDASERARELWAEYREREAG